MVVPQEYFVFMWIFGDSLYYVGLGIPSKCKILLQLLIGLIGQSLFWLDYNLDTKVFMDGGRTQFVKMLVKLTTFF